MADLKPISRQAIPAALEKANHYRLLNQPWQAESICRDILRTDPNNQKVIYTLVLAITDQFEEGKFKTNLANALEEVEQLDDPYQAEYCTGLIYERQALSAMKRQTPRAGYIAFDYIQRAMIHYENAEKIRPEMNDESVLRWNACMRFIQKNKLKQSPKEKGTQPFLDV
jgi:tetratricopeptide (TPR) repeat protein